MLARGQISDTMMCKQTETNLRTELAFTFWSEKAVYLQMLQIGINLSKWRISQGCRWKTNCLASLPCKYFIFGTWITALGFSADKGIKQDWRVIGYKITPVYLRTHLDYLCSTLLLSFQGFSSITILLFATVHV